jgi:hypothetical protein
MPTNAADLSISEDQLNAFGEHLYRAYKTVATGDMADIRPVKEAVMAATGLSAAGFDLYLDELIQLSVVGRSYFNLDLQTETTPPKANGYAKRLRDKQCIIAGHPLYGITVTISPSENVYNGYQAVTWEQVQVLDEIFIDNYQHGAFPKANPKISGPYLITDRKGRWLKHLHNGRQLRYAPDTLLKRKGTAG